MSRSYSKDLTSPVVCKFQSVLCNDPYYGECIRHLNWSTYCLSPRTKKEFEPMNSSVIDHLPFCNHSASFDDLSNLTRESKKFLLEDATNSTLCVTAVYLIFSRMVSFIHILTV